ncbi:universal stress protein [Kitasatospora cineracea]|uniref:universal stress protein n=1 Tax=Kitasatospora cineracea TaxID=88074 RepID=UPI0034369BC7
MIIESRPGTATTLLSPTEHAALLVLGRHPHLLGHSLGPVAHTAVHHRPTPVLLVPQP